MKATTVSCPSCGAAHDVYNPGVIMYVCEYCSNAVYWDEEKIKVAGKQSVLPEGFTRLYRGAAGSFADKRFVVLGRARYSFGRGFWDEWFIEMFNGQTQWLTEDNHELAVQAEIKGVSVAPFESYPPGATLTVRKRTFMVQEAGTAECVGLEGDLPKSIETGETYRYVDASSLDGRYTIGIEYDEEVATVFAGRWLKHSALRLDDEGVDW
jgi:hypothetical protein